MVHWGPSSLIMPLQIGETPIVVPRQYKYNEHVNDNQVKFCKEVESRMGTIVVVEDIEKLGGAGFMLFYVPEEKQEAVREALSHLREMEFEMDNSGSSIIFIDDNKK